MTKNHEITISNLKKGETIHYSVIIIKGTINNIKSTCQNRPETILVESNSFKILNDKFKAIVELKLGQNDIVFEYCCVTMSISLNFEKRKSKFSVLPLYIICEGHDGRFQAPQTERNDVESARKRITLGIKLLQSVIAEKIYEENLGRKTFQLEDDCQIFRSNLDCLKARRMSQEELWNYFGTEIINSGLDDERIKFLGFLSCTKYCGENYEEYFTHEDVVGITEAYVALGGGGLALFGSGCLYTWPENFSKILESFESSVLVNKREFMDDSCYRGTLGACFSTTLGSVLHELCHTFDLGHTEKGIMGRGFDNIYKVFVSNSEKLSLQNYQNSIEFEENIGSKSLKEELYEKRKKFFVKNSNVKDEDLTFWTKSCLVFLAYHKWLNDFDTFGNKTIKFDVVTKFVSSSAGLRVIELRNEEDGMVLRSWFFDGRILKYSFQLPESFDGEGSVIMFIEDNFGNIFKKKM